jgi:hypothetical protein
VRLELTTEGDDGRPALRIDGQVPDPVPALTWTDAIGMPFTAIYLDGQRQYDTELWLDGILRDTVPPKSPQVDAVYDRLEAQNRGEPVPEDELPEPGAPEDMHLRRKAVNAELKTHPGRVAYVRWQALRRTADVHARNASELLGLLQGIATDPLVAIELMQNVRPPDVADEVNAQIDQRLHNYVASAASLIDHTRNLFKHYEGRHVAVEYATRKDVLAAEPVNGFVRDLRNFALHRSLPWVGHKVSFGGGGQDIRAETRLGTAELLAWDSWKAPAKAFLAAAGEAVVLLATIEQHQTLVGELQDWVFRQFEGLHRAEMAEVNALIDESNWLLSGGREGRPRPRSRPTTDDGMQTSPS